jgi:hypothetical protein
MSSDIVNRCKSKFFKGWKGNAQWILEAGEALSEAFQSLSLDEYLDLEFMELDFSTKTGQRLRKIGSDQRLKDPRIRENLPDSYGSIEVLCSLPDTQFYELVNSNLFNPSITRQQITDFKNGVSYIEKKSKEPTKSKASSSQMTTFEKSAKDWLNEPPPQSLFKRSKKD